MKKNRAFLAHSRLDDDKMEDLLSLGNEGLSFIEIERGGRRMCGLCVDRVQLE